MTSKRTSDVLPTADAAISAAAMNGRSPQRGLGTRVEPRLRHVHLLDEHATLQPHWDLESWKARQDTQAIDYPDSRKLAAVHSKLRALPPLVTPSEIVRLKQLLAEAQEGRRFVVQGGDCAETLADCQPLIIANKLKLLLQLSLVTVHECKLPVIRLGRLAGQYAKPRSKAVESRFGVARPSYFGDMVNRADFSEEGRRPNPENLLTAYGHAALTLNFIRSLSSNGFADIHHPEYWELPFFRSAAATDDLREQYERMAREVGEAIRFMETLGETSIEQLMHVDFYTSHEGLNLHYESAQTRQSPRHPGWYDLTTHFPWIGERTRALDGAHIEFFRGIQNPLGIKLGPTTTTDQVLRLVDTLNPSNEAGKITLITRMGADVVTEVLPGVVEALDRSGRTVLWMCDPMHGNTQTAPSGRKTRDFEHILREVERTFDVHEACGTLLGGIHFEMTGEDVTECIGGAAGVTLANLGKNYATACDPRLNYRQALEMGFRIAKRLGQHSAPGRNQLASFPRLRRVPADLSGTELAPAI